MSQKGYTLVELLVALAVGSLVIVAALAVIHQVVWNTSRANSQVIVLTDANQAALQLKKDIQMAQLDKGDFPADGTTVITLTPDGPTVTLSWTDYTSFDPAENKNHSSSYELLGSELQRTYDGTTSIVGRNITSVDITQGPEDDRVINVIITAAKGGISPRSETLKFSVYMRGEGIQL